MHKICSVYTSLGNCEYYYTEGNPCFSDEIVGTGVTFLEKAHMDIVINKQQIRIGGQYGAAYKNYEKFFCHEIDEKNEKFLLDFQSTERLKVMLLHRPFVASGNIFMRRNMLLIVAHCVQNKQTRTLVENFIFNVAIPGSYHRRISHSKRWQSRKIDI